MALGRLMAVVLVFAAALAAVEVGPVPLVRVNDGDTLTVTMDGKEERVRLLWVDTPETSDNGHGKEMPEGAAATDYVRKLLKDHPQVMLWGPREGLERDRYGRLLAIVAYPNPDWDHKLTVNGMLIIGGWSVYWRKYGDAGPFDGQFSELQQEAKREGRGAWASAGEWMSDKANERTKPKGE